MQALYATRFAGATTVVVSPTGRRGTGVVFYFLMLFLG
jgi:hypothetical protein